MQRPHDRHPAHWPSQTSAALAASRTGTGGRKTNIGIDGAHTRAISDRAFSGRGHLEFTRQKMKLTLEHSAQLSSKDRYLRQTGPI